MQHLINYQLSIDKILKRILSQAKKELAQFSRDRLTVALALILPLGMLLIYGYAIRLETKNIPREKTCSKLPALPEVPFRYFLVN